MSVSVRWDMELVARSSIVHGGDAQGTTTTFRRELMPQPDGGWDMVPVVSGNSFRSALRRLSEGLFTDALDLDGELSTVAADVLQSGGSLAKTAKQPLTGSRRAEVRRWVPPLALFGGAATGTLIDGAVRVGKVLPVVAETNLVTGVTTDVSMFDVLQVEEFSRVDRGLGEGDTAQMRYQLEVLVTGTRFVTSVQVDRVTELQLAVMEEVLDVFCHAGSLGGRVGTGHGHVTGTRTVSVLRGQVPEQLPDWRADLAAGRDQVLDALKVLA